MLIQHPHYPSIPQNITLWRYIDLFKFEDLLKTSSLYFGRADELTRFDVREGSLTKRMREFFDEGLFTSKFVKNLKSQGITTFDKKTQLNGRGTLAIRDELRQRARTHYQYLLSRTYINCWNIKNEENYLMWQSYIKRPPGVVIRSSYERLQRAMTISDQEVIALAVDYVDHDAAPLVPERLPGGMSQIVLDMLSKKMKAFDGESEIRFITDTLIPKEKWAPTLVGGHLNTYLQNDKQSVLIKVNLDELIEGIVLHPRSDGLFRNRVIEIIKDHASDNSNLANLVVKSAIDLAP